MSEKHELSKKEITDSLGFVIANAAFHPNPSAVLGRDITTLRDKCAEAVYDLLCRTETDPTVVQVRESQLLPYLRDDEGDFVYENGPTFFDSQDQHQLDSIRHHQKQIIQRASVIRALEDEMHNDKKEK